jgi:hypothetical protein
MAVGEIRTSQLITTYGVGAIVALEDEAFMVAGIDRWNVDGPNLREPRLERELRVSGFVTPPATGRDDIPVVRFPVWHSCPVCKLLAPHNSFTSYQRNRCNVCDQPLIPSRFVMVCSRGHIDDFPYFRWVHRGRKSEAKRRHEMRIETHGNTGSLASIVITCDCGAQASMDGAFGRGALRDVSRCTGHRPWLIADDETCAETPRTLQRGASNVWFPVVRSALSIPPWSEGAYKIVNRYWRVLGVLADQEREILRMTIDGMDLVEGTDYTVDDLVEAVLQRKERESGSDDDEPLKLQEFQALIRGKAERSRSSDFVCIPAELGDDVAAAWFDQVMLVKRLREVRVLEQFTRILPPGPVDPPERRARLSEQSMGWLPAIDVIGEGVFLRLNEERLRTWEARERVRARAAKVNDKYVDRFRDSGNTPDRVITARFLLVHSLAHALINQWALDSGYPAAALRERLYVSDDMAGILIYTATSDSAGSLGGVVGQAEDGRLDQALSEALTTASWCSSDPLCIETEVAGVDALNLAACHACLLLPEVSCEEMNVLLDRGMLVGVPDVDNVGFFEDLLQGK